MRIGMLMILASAILWGGCSRFKSDKPTANGVETEMRAGDAKFGGSGSITKGGGTVGQ